MGGRAWRAKNGYSGDWRVAVRAERMQRPVLLLLLLPVLCKAGATAFFCVLDRRSWASGSLPPPPPPPCGLRPHMLAMIPCLLRRDHLVPCQRGATAR